MSEAAQMYREKYEKNLHTGDTITIPIKVVENLSEIIKKLHQFRFEGTHMQYGDIGCIVPLSVAELLCETIEDKLADLNMVELLCEFGN